MVLGIDTDGLVNGFISNSDLSAIKTLDVSYAKIRDLTGIEQFTNLEVLNCYHNLLTSLDLSKNTHLNVLNCSSNLLYELDLSSNLELKELYCFDNQLSDDYQNYLKNYCKRYSILLSAH